MKMTADISMGGVPAYPINQDAIKIGKILCDFCGSDDFFTSATVVDKNDLEKSRQIHLCASCTVRAFNGDTLVFRKPIEPVTIPIKIKKAES